MSKRFISRGFRGRRRQKEQPRLPPGQYLVEGFPVLSAGPTPRTPLEEWDFSIVGEVDEARRLTWEEFRALPSETITTDIHCVTKWSKLGTTWEGVSIDTLLEGIDTAAEHVLAFCDGGYTTDLPLEDVTGGKAWVAYSYEGEPLEPEHGGPARLLVPHLYFWKSAKWVRGLQLVSEDEPGFWEELGYHNHGDPWREQRYWRTRVAAVRGKLVWRLGEPRSAAVELLRHQLRSARHAGDDFERLVPRQHGRQPLWPPSPNGPAGELRKSLPSTSRYKNSNALKARFRLTRRPFSRPQGASGTPRPLARSSWLGMALAVEMDVAFDPVNITFFRAIRHVPESACLANERDKLLGFPALPRGFRHLLHLPPPVTLLAMNRLTQLRIRPLSRDYTECVRIITSWAARSTPRIARHRSRTRATRRRQAWNEPWLVEALERGDLKGALRLLPSVVQANGTPARP